MWELLVDLLKITLSVANFSIKYFISLVVHEIESNPDVKKIIEDIKF